MGDLRKKEFVYSFLLRLFSVAMGIMLLLPIEAGASISDSTEVKSVSEALIDANNDGEFDFLNQYITVSGRASVASSVFSDQNLTVYIQDTKSGILVFSDTLKQEITSGDSLIVAGKLELYYGKPEVVVDSLRIVQTDSRNPTPIPVQDAFKSPKRYLGMLVEGEAVVTRKNMSSDYTSLTISHSDTSGSSLTVFVDDAHSYRQDFNFDMLRVGDRIHITGIMDTYTFQESGNTIYEILPRTPEDLQYSGMPQRYVMLLLWGAGILILIIGGWVWSLKKQVRSQTKDLQQALEDRAILMQEIHHRVKNNLAMIAGLLDLQMDTTSLEEVKDKLEDSKSRIQSMALIHDKLYQTESYRSVRLDNYLQELVEAIYQTFSDKQEDVELRFSLEPLEMKVDKAVTCGLLVNELVVNAFKHAFDSKDQGMLKVELSKHQDKATLVISDNGPGLPDDFDNKTDSLGSLLIDTFASQLEAERDIESENGSTFTFRFPLN
ncbi:histidine kinase dimerization/phosphoacceptor domain -containing protein [Fodinibius sp. AD559]|uniref:histidine kinase dimerization/phosphoacceptor domain -containing protein n=1 Tax=Fodinibius sp. AD559 TaxID=3424179 RepID=UPI004046E09C